MSDSGEQDHEMGTPDNTTSVPPESPTPKEPWPISGPVEVNNIVQGWYGPLLYRDLPQALVEMIKGKPEGTVLAAVMLTRDILSHTDLQNAIAEAFADKLFGTGHFLTTAPIHADPSRGANPRSSPRVSFIYDVDPELYQLACDQEIFSTRMGPRGYTFYVVPRDVDRSWYTLTLYGAPENVDADAVFAAWIVFAATKFSAFILDHHSRFPDLPDQPHTVQSILEAGSGYASYGKTQFSARDANGRTYTAHGVQIYFPPPPLENDLIDKWLKMNQAADVVFDVGFQGRVRPWRGNDPTNPKLMSCTECMGIDHYAGSCPVAKDKKHRDTHNLPPLDESDNAPQDSDGDDDDTPMSLVAAQPATSAPRRLPPRPNNNSPFKREPRRDEHRFKREDHRGGRDEYRGGRDDARRDTFRRDDYDRNGRNEYRQRRDGKHRSSFHPYP